MPVGNRHMHCKALLQVVVAALISHTFFKEFDQVTLCVRISVYGENSIVF